MRIQSALLVSLLVGLYGCQQQTSEPQQAAPAAVATPAASESVAPAAESAKPTAVEKAAEPATASAPALSAAAKAVLPTKVEKPAAPAKVAAPVASLSGKEDEPAKSVAVAATAKPARIEAPAPATAPAPVKPEAVSEVDALALAKRNNCLACHAVDHKVVGPAWQDVAAKYRGDASAEARLVNKIAKGGSGVWGSMQMPAHPKLSEGDRTTLARFVLNLK